MSEKTLQFNDIILNKKEFHKSKEPIVLFSVNIDQIVVSNKFKHNNKVTKKVKLLNHYALFYLSGYTKYFENGGKNIPFLIKDDEVWDKYDKSWDVIKDKLGINFHSEPVHEYKHLKAKVREFDAVIKTNFLGNDVSKENMHYTCIACITIDCVLRIDKKIIRKFF